MIWNKRKKSAVAIYIIAAIVYTLLVTVIPFPKPAGSWLMFAFSLISLFFGAFVSLYAFSKEETLISKFYGYPVFRIGFIYTTLQIILSIVVFTIGAYVNVPYWVGMIISVLLLGMAAIGIISADNSRDYIEEIDIKTVSSVMNTKKFNNDIADIMDLCKNDTIREPLQKLVTKFKYSDPVSSNATKEKENQIKAEIENLKVIINSESTEIVLEKINTISNLLSSRNRICEVNKYN